jgi:ABC-2 type transport system ATP-binding protein
MTDYLKKWVADGKSLILASHVLHEVEAVNPSFLLMSGGRLLASGSPGEVRALMTHCPNVFKITSNQSRKLAELIVREVDVDQIDIDNLNETLQVSTRDSAELYEKLTTIVVQSGITIRRVSSSDESLQELFTNLMKIHRGEI